MTISVDPHALGLSVTPWVTLFTLAAVALGVLLFLRAAGKAGLSQGLAYGLTVRVVGWGFVGAKVLHVVDYAGFYVDAPLRALYLWEGGLSLWGALLGGLAGLAWHSGRHAIAWRRIVDLAAPSVFAAMVLGRIGDLIAGERPATPSSLPWAIEYTHADSPAHLPFGGSVHPVAGYEALLDLVVLALFWCLRRRTVADGVGTAVALGFYAGGRSIIGIARVDPTWFGLQQAQWIGLIAVAVCAWQAWGGCLKRENL